MLVVCGLEQVDQIIDIGIGSKQIFPPIVIEIKEAVTPATTRRGENAQPALVSGVLEQTLSQILKQRKRFTCQGRDVEIRQTVVVVIAKICPHAGHRQSVVRKSHSGLEPHLLECPVTAIVEQEVRQVVVGDKHIHQAVVIIIGKSDAHTATNMRGDARLDSDVLESPIAPVPVKGVG